MNFEEAIEYLYRLRNRGSKYGIDRMRLLVEQLGHPERRFPIIHVAGTNGKGSVCAMLESIFRAAGYKTGLFTSPHLIHLGERVQINRCPISDERIVELTKEIAAAGAEVAREDDDLHPTFFEFLTAMAFLEFEREHVDIGILETGLGGRLDSTNVVSPEITVITSIGLDHMEQLGDTLAAIAREKAGIIKAGVPLVCGKLPPEAAAVINTIARERGAPVHHVAAAFADETLLPETSLAGSIQRWNAAVAVLVVQLLRNAFPVSDEIIARGLSSVDWAGRWEKTTYRGREIIFDATHNAESATVLEEHLRRLTSGGMRPDLVVGVLGAHRAAAILPVVARYAATVYLVAPDQPRALPPEELIRHLPSDFKGTTILTSVESLFSPHSRLFQSGIKTPLVITGSLYLLGEVKSRLNQETSPLRTLQDRI